MKTAQPFRSFVSACLLHPLRALTAAGWLTFSAAGLPAAAEEWRLVLRVTETTITRPSAKPSAGEPPAAAVQRAAAAEPVTETRTYEKRLTFGADYLASEEEKETEIYDFGSRRHFRLSAETNDHLDVSLYALVAFRVRELQNRIVLGNALRAGGVKEDSGMLDPFEAESLFGLELPEKAAPGAPPAPAKPDGFSRRVREDGGVEFVHGDRVVVGFTSGTLELAEGRRRDWERFLIHECAIHPRIRAQLVEAGHLPARLEFTSRDSFRTRTTVFESLRAEVAPAQTPGQRLAGRAPRQPLESEPLLAAIARTTGARPPTKAEAIAFADAAIAAGRPLDGLLALLEHGFQTGDQPTDEIRRHKKTFERDEPCRRFFGGRGQANNEERERSLAAYDSIDRTNLQKAYVLDILRANMLGPLGRSAEAKRLLIAALEVNPFLGGVYGDLGNLHFHAYEMAEAWTCWDVGRRLHPGHRLLAGATELERRFARDFPHLF